MTDAQRSASAQARRARRLASKREAVRRIALRLVLDDGLDGATVEAISAAADITPRTFYNYFTSKEDALAMERSWAGDEVAELVRSRPEDENVWDSLQIVLTEVATTLEGSRDDAQMYHEMYRRYPALQRAQRTDTTEELTGPLIDAVAERRGATTDPDLRSVAIVHAALSVMQAALRVHWSTQRASPIGETVAEGFSALTAR